MNRLYTGATCERTCERCGGAELFRQWQAGREMRWEKTPHNAPCGMPCRPQPHRSDVHGFDGCATCGPPRRRRRRAA